LDILYKRRIDSRFGDEGLEGFGEDVLGVCFFEGAFTTFAERGADGAMDFYLVDGR
jgi:hypothetical protein